MAEHTRDQDGDSSTLSTISGPEVVSLTATEVSIGEGDLVSQRDLGLQHSKERIYEELANKQFPLEESALIVRQFEKSADRNVRATFFNGVRAQEIADNAIEPRVGLTFMAGADTPQVNRMEQIGMTQSKPDQKTATWRVNTAGALLRNFDVDKDLSIIQSDNTSAVIRKVRERQVLEGRPYAPAGNRSSSSNAVIGLRREDRTVTIDSDKVQIMDDLSLGKWDLESTLIEVDGSSLTALIVNYRHLISSGGPVLTFTDTIQLLDVMIEDARRLCVRSPILFRMSTRWHIISSKNTRYGIDHGTMFRTLTTSRGIKNIIELSASYFNSLASAGGKDKSQEIIRPRFLQMLVLLLSLLNDDDLAEIASFLGDTYKINAERQHVELLILKVLPLMSINSRIFVNAMALTFEGPHIQLDRKYQDEASVWKSFITRRLKDGYVLPGTLDQMGQHDYSWIIKWPEEGIKDTHVFNNLQYNGDKRTINEIPPMDLSFDSGSDELTVVLTNGSKYILGTSDLEKITCMTRGRYSITQAEAVARTFDLEVTEEVVNKTLYDAIHKLNNIIDQLNSYLATPRRSGVLMRMQSMRLSNRNNSHRETNSFSAVKGSGRLTYNLARLNEQILAAAYKVDGRKITRRDLIRNLASDLGKVGATIHVVETAMLDFDSRGVTGDVRQHIHFLRQTLAEIKVQVAQAEQNKARLDRHVVELPDEPVSKVLYPSGAERSTNPIWNNYQAWYHYPDNLLYIDALRRYVDRAVWISDDIIEISFQNVPAKYFVSTLRPVLEGERFDEIQVGDEVLLIGLYVVVVEAEEGGLGVVTNWLKVTGVEQGAVSRRGMNRRREEAPTRSVLR